MENIKEIFEKINNANNILITAHINPDGDAVGSCLALYNYIKLINKNVQVCLDEVPDKFSFLLGFDEIIGKETINKEYDMLIVLDCSDSDRINIPLDTVKCAQVISLDHHITYKQFTKYTILDVDACATCQIVYDCFEKLNIQINEEIAKAIYTGILTDTGTFRNSNVTAHTFQTAEQLVRLGVNPNQIAQNVSDKMSLNKFELVKIALNNIEIVNEKISYLYLSKDILDRYSQNEYGIHEGLVNYGRDISGIEVSIFIRQLDDEEYKVSLRSNSYVDVAQIADNYGGGGHIMAAGINYKGKLEDIKNILIEEINKQL